MSLRICCSRQDTSPYAHISANCLVLCQPLLSDCFVSPEAMFSVFELLHFARHLSPCIWKGTTSGSRQNLSSSVSSCRLSLKVAQPHTSLYRSSCQVAARKAKKTIYLWLDERGILINPLNLSFNYIFTLQMAWYIYFPRKILKKCLCAPFISSNI